MRSIGVGVYGFRGFGFGLRGLRFIGLKGLRVQGKHRAP